jgi:hypothetical protein
MRGWFRVIQAGYLPESSQRFTMRVELGHLNGSNAEVALTRGIDFNTDG